MPTRDEVYRQIAAWPHRYTFWPWSFWVNKGIRSLPAILDDGETIKALTSGTVNSDVWLAVCTDRRLIFLNRGTLWGTEETQMPLDRVQSIDHQFALFFGTIRVFDGINEFILTMVMKNSILPFVKAAEAAMYALRHQPVTIAGAAPPSPVAAPAAAAAAHPADVATQLQKLVDLKEKGYLTDAEFQTQKKKLLGS